MGDHMSDTATMMKPFRCPNGLVVWNSPESGHETRFIYDEIFERRCYERHDVHVRDGDVILDVGANIGLFTLSLMERHRGLRIVCMEPVPNTRACLIRNVNESPWRVHHEVAIVPDAMGATRGTATISYYRRAPGNSTMHPREKRREWEAISDRITARDIWSRNKLLALMLLPIYPWRRRLFTRWVAPVLDDVDSVTCEVRTVSEIIREHGISRLDLLKIDVEGAELDVLEGIEEQHWPRIRQVAMEIAPSHQDVVTGLASRMRARGFANVAFESIRGGTVLDDGAPCTLYAVRAPNPANVSVQGG
jgi:FkbM family methyltransferase